MIRFIRLFHRNLDAWCRCHLGKLLDFQAFRTKRFKRLSVLISTGSRSCFSCFLLQNSWAGRRPFQYVLYVIWYINHAYSKHPKDLRFAWMCLQAFYREDTLPRWLSTLPDWWNTSIAVSENIMGLKWKKLSKYRFRTIIYCKGCKNLWDEYPQF